MKKLVSFCLLTVLGLGMFISNGSKVYAYEKNDYIKNATVCDGSQLNRSYYDPCDNILRVGEYLIFGWPFSDGIMTFRVDAVDAAGDSIYNSVLDAWIPAHPISEVDSSGRPSGDQILRVGELFAIIGLYGDAPSINGLSAGIGYIVHAVDAPTDSVKINFLDKWGNRVPTWIKAASPNEYGCDHPL